MNQSDAEARIKQMITLIEQEANEKAKFILEEAKSKMEREKNKIYNLQREKVLQEFKEREENDRVQKRLEKSRKVNATRLEIQKHRNALLEDLKGAIQKKMMEELKNRDKYQELMVKLCVQGLIRLIEKDVKLMVLKADVDMVKQFLPEVKSQYQKFMKESIGKDLDVNLEVIENKFLTDEDLGGVSLYCENFKIVFSNTLKMRLELGFNHSIPHIRKNLFPSLDRKEEKPEAKPAKKE